MREPTLKCNKLLGDMAKKNRNTLEHNTIVIVKKNINFLYTYSFTYLSIFLNRYFSLVSDILLHVFYSNVLISAVFFIFYSAKQII